MVQRDNPRSTEGVDMVLEEEDMVLEEIHRYTVTEGRR